MNNKVVIFVVSAVSLAAGFGGGFVLGSHLMKKRYDDIVTQMNDELNEYVDKAMTSSKKSVDETTNKTDYTDYISTLNDVEKKMFEQAPDKEVFIHAREMVKKNDELKSQYLTRSKIGEHVETSKEYEDRMRTAMGLDPDDESEFATDLLEAGPDKEGTELLADAPLDPYLITETEYFDNQFENFSKIQMTYFSDGVMIDDGDSIVPAFEDLIGDENILELETSDNNTIFVRNEANSTDYEIVYKEMTYGEFMGAN